MSFKHTQRGKWSLAGVPHRGWSCVYVEDVEEDQLTCEMCESSEVRFVHYMKHQDYPNELAVGCVCAEHMEENYQDPKHRERKIRNKARRQVSWDKRKWLISAKKNSYLNVEGFNIVVYEKIDQQGKYWFYKITNHATGNAAFPRRRIATEQEAKSASLGGLIWAKEHLISNEEP